MTAYSTKISKNVIIDLSSPQPPPPPTHLLLGLNHLICICEGIRYINSLGSPCLCEEDTFHNFCLIKPIPFLSLLACLLSPFLFCLSLQRAGIWMGRSTTKPKPWKIILVLKKPWDFLWNLSTRHLSLSSPTSETQLLFYLT